MEKDNFNFIEQIKKGNLYELLVPKKEQGLIVFELFEELENRNTPYFTEEDLKQIISSHKKHEIREQHEDIKNIIRDLSEYFLKERENGYELTEYAKDFARTIKEKLKGDFQPSDIEKTLLSLKKTFPINIEQFEDWYKIDFEDKKKNIETQLESLERQIKNAIRQFKEQVLNDTVVDKILLSKILDNLSKISEKMKTLKGVLGYINDIEVLLHEKINTDDIYNAENWELLRSSKTISSFLDRIRDDLERASKKNNSVITRIRQFYRNIVSLEIEQNTKLFLNFLLKNSTEINGKIHLPSFKSTNLNRSIFNLKQNFIFLTPKKELFRNTRIADNKSKTDTITFTKQRKQQQKIIEKNNQRNVVLERIEYELKEHNFVDCSSFFTELLGTKIGIHIVPEIAFLLIKKYSKSKKYNLIISEKLQKHEQEILFSNIQITKLI